MGSAARKFDYDYQYYEEQFKKNNINSTNKYDKTHTIDYDLKMKRELERSVGRDVEISFVQQSAVQKILSILITCVFLSVIVFLGSSVITRYAQINLKQYEVFTMKQAINDAKAKKELLIVKMESSISLEELEKYARLDLDMIKADEGNKLIVGEVKEARLSANLNYRGTGSLFSKSE